MVDETQPASEQFDLTLGMDFNQDVFDDLAEIVNTLEQAEAAPVTEWDSEELADVVETLKRAENAIEDARKDIFETELKDRIDINDEIGNLRKQQGKHSYVTDTEGALATASDRGVDPVDVVKVNVGDLRDALGADADEFIGSKEYTYFKTH